LASETKSPARAMKPTRPSMRKASDCTESTNMIGAVKIETARKACPMAARSGDPPAACSTIDWPKARKARISPMQRARARPWAPAEEARGFLDLAGAEGAGEHARHAGRNHGGKRHQQHGDGKHQRHRRQRLGADKAAEKNGVDDRQQPIDAGQEDDGQGGADE